MLRLLLSGVGGVAGSVVFVSSGRSRRLARSVCRSHLPGGNRSRPSELRKRARALSSRGLLRLLRLRYTGSGSCRAVGGRGRSRWLFLRWARRCNRQVSAYCSSSDWRASTAGTTTNAVAQQHLQTLQFCAKLLQPLLVAFARTLKRLGNGIFQSLDLVIDPAGFIVPPTRRTLQVSNQTLNILQCSIQALCACFFSRLERRSIRRELLDEGKGAGKLFIDILFILFKLWRRRWCNKRTDISLE